MGKKKFADAPTGKWYTPEGWPPKSAAASRDDGASTFTLRSPPPTFVQNFEARSNQFSKLDNKYKLQGTGECVGKKELSLKRLESGALLHQSQDLIAWNNTSNSEFQSRTHSTYTAPPPDSVVRESSGRRFKRKAVPPTKEYKLTTTTSCWNPDPLHQTLYKVLAETQHRHNKPNTWQYSTHHAHKLADLYN